MASIRERTRKDGTITWAVLWRNADDGKQTSRTFVDKREAQLLKDFLDANGNSFTAAEQAASRLRSEAPTVAAVITEHIETLTGVLAGTRQKYARMAARHITPALGSWPVDTLTRNDVARWLNNLELSAKSKRNVHAILSAALTDAVEAKLIDANPAKGIRMPTGERRREPVFLTREQVEAIATAVGEDYQLLVRLLAGTGLRWSEATALTAGDCQVDDEHGTVSVTKAWKHEDSRMVLGAPKTKRGRRAVALSAALTMQLREHLTYHHAGDLVFTRNGRTVRNDVFQHHVWAPALDTLGDTLPRRPRIHDLRHSHASHLIAAGVALPVIQRRLGHESITTTINVYGHLADDADRLAVAALDR